MYLYHSIDLSHNVPLLSVPFPQLGSKLWAGITSYTPLSLSTPCPPWTEHRTRHSRPPHHILPSPWLRQAAVHPSPMSQVESPRFKAWCWQSRIFTEKTQMLVTSQRIKKKRQRTVWVPREKTRSWYNCGKNP